MKNRKKKIKLFPILGLIIVIIVVIYAISLVSKVFDKITPNKNEILNREDPQKNQEEILLEITPDDVEADAIVIPEEDNIVYEADAPKPLYTQMELLEKYEGTVLSKTEDAGETYIDDIIFIGDSTTHGMAFYAVLKGGKETTQVWTPKSGTLAMWNLLTETIVFPDDGSQMLIGDAISLKQPKIVVLTLGVNGVSSLKEKEFKKYYSDLIDLIKEKSPDTKIILQSIYPVCDYYEIKSISMEKINSANVWIVELAKGKEVYYLNTISALIGENGYLKNEYCNGDGIHISKAGFSVILDYIKTHSVYK